MTRSRDVAIVGIYEYPLRDVEGKISPLQMKAECAASALADAGLNWSDVDAIYDAGEGGGMGGLTIAEYFGLNPNVIDTTNVGGSSYQFHAAHARRDIQSGKAKVALLTYGSTAHSNARAIGVGGRGGASMHPAENMDAFAGMTLISITRWLLIVTCMNMELPVVSWPKFQSQLDIMRCVTLRRSKRWRIWNSSISERPRLMM